MPNRCHNNVKIITKKDYQIDEIINAIKWEWLFQHFIPRTDEVRKDRVLESIFGWCNWEEIKEKLWIPRWKSWLDRKELWFKECPYKQLWFDWQRENWGSKWDIEKDENREPSCRDVDLLEFEYDSARNPHTKWWQQISQILHCRIEIAFDEPWCAFSWEYIYDDGILVQQVDYDDWYYGNGKKCSICGWVYDNSNPDDWDDDAHSLCVWCAEDFRNKQNKDAKVQWERK